MEQQVPNTTDSEQLPPEMEELVAEMKAAKLAKIEVIGRQVSDKRAAAIKGRKESGIETIWEEDEEHYLGIDDANRDTHPWVKSASPSGGISRQQSKSETRCSSFFNITRQFTESGSARMGDILLPAGDWNFSVKATPVQDDQPSQIPVAQPQIDPQTGQPVSPPIDDTDAVQLEAVKKAKKAELWIQDKLVECSYHSEVRKVIENAAKVGTGILRGPTPKKMRSIKTVGNEGSTGVMIAETINPSSKFVDNWDFFPDPACGDNIHNGSYVFERDRLTAKQLSDLKGTPGYLNDQIDKVLDEGPSKCNYANGYKDPIRTVADDDKYEIWYYHGLVDVDVLANMEVKLSDSDKTKELVPAVVTLVNETPIKAFINPLDSGDFPYDVITWQRMAGFWAGVGIARQGRTAQDMLNAAARALMDNAGLGSGPQVLIRENMIRPQNGKWTLTPRKIWLATENADIRDVAEALRFINVPMVQNELNAIIQLAYKMMEDATGIVYLLQGQQGSAPDTVGGMELLHRNASALLRRIARVFDEQVTEPHIRRYYEWLLIHGPDDCKGDLKIEAIGSTALVEREIQAMEALQLLQLSVNPVYGLDPEKAMIEVLKAKRYIPEKWMMDDAKKKALPPPTIPAIEVAKIQAAQDDKRLALEKDKEIAGNTLTKHRIDVDTDRDTKYVEAMAQRDQANAMQRAQELAIKRELALMEYANKRGINLDTVKAELAKTAMTLREQRILSRVGKEPAKQVATPKAEPAGKADDGFAFQE